MKHAVHIGTSGWSYADWVGPFYPPGTPESDYLPRYANEFDVVEVDSTFYHPPTRRMVQRWADVTPGQFRFALKVPREITHERVLKECGGTMELVLDAVGPLGDKLQCLLLQFGYFNRSAFSSGAAFLERLESFLEAYARRAPFAAEIRNKTWLTEGYFDLLRRFNVATALVEHAWLPPVDRVLDAHDVVTGPFAYLRLIGDREGIEQITKTWDKPVVDRSADLGRVAQAIRRLAERVPVVTFVNNHYAGHGPATCWELRRALAE